MSRLEELLSGLKAMWHVITYRKTWKDTIYTTSICYALILVNYPSKHAFNDFLDRGYFTYKDFKFLRPRTVRYIPYRVMVLSLFILSRLFRKSNVR